MKWFIIALAAAAALIGIGLVAAGSHGDGRITRDPAVAALCDEGTADLNAFRLPAAVEKLGRCLERDPALAEASISRTLAFARLGERQSMKRELARADSLTGLLKNDRRRLVAQLRLSALTGSRYYPMRDSVYTILVGQMPDDIYVLEAAATRAAQSQDADRTAEAWRRVVDTNPNYARSYNELGYIELNRGNYDLAIDYIQRYAFLAPDLANPHDSLGDVYMVLGRYEEAEAEYQTAVRMQPDFYFSLINLGKVYLARGQLRRGIEILEAVREKVAGSELELGVDREIIRTYLRTGLFPELDAATARFVARYPEAEDTAIYRAVRLAYLSRPQEARALMDSSLAAWRADKRYGELENARMGVDYAAHQFEGIAADLAGDGRRAAEAWAAALGVMQDKASRHELFYLHYRLAAALCNSGRPREALAEIDPIVAVNPRLPEQLLLKTRCHLELGEIEAAARTLAQLERALVAADPGLPVLAEAAALRTRLGRSAPAQ